MTRSSIRPSAWRRGALAALSSWWPVARGPRPCQDRVQRHVGSEHTEQLDLTSAPSSPAAAVQ